jgi:uncharacterized RDD family membrane protein YckC
MLSEQSGYRNFPKVPIERRASAFLIDFVAVWLISSLTGNWVLQFFIFMVAWLGMRVVVVDRNQGQSLGRWALDMKIIDPRIKKIPDLLTLSKREGILGFASFLATIGLNINFANGISMLIFISPLIADCGLALADEQFHQAFHDRAAQTLIIQTRRGFSLDLRLKKLWVQFKRNRRR